MQWSKLKRSVDGVIASTLGDWLPPTLDCRVYTTCLFCNGALGTNEVIEHFPVGRRLAFDSAKGRLWVVCCR